jgi:hypothetical protein
MTTRRFVASWDDDYWQVSLGVDFFTRFSCRPAVPAEIRSSGSSPFEGACGIENSCHLVIPQR